MGCVFGKNGKSESQPSNGGRGRKPPLEAGLRFLGTSKNKLPLAARTNEIHAHAFPAIRAVLQSDREMEIPKAKKGIGLCGFTGLDTSILCQRENYCCDVVFLTADVGRAMADIAKEVGADAVSHGCTGKGNGQVRFEPPFFALNPMLNVVAPWREWDIRWREDAIEYAKHNVPVPVTKKFIYSGDRKHLSLEGDILEDPANEPKKDMCMLTVDPEEALKKSEYIEIGIESGLPVLVNGKVLSPASLLAELNEIGGKDGIGQIDIVEIRLVGMKSRGIYETLGGTILFDADAAGFFRLFGLPMRV